MTTAQALPMWVCPLPDEVTSSFIVRLAMLFRLKLQTFSRIVWPNEVLWHLDVDRFPPAFLLESLARTTNLPLTTIEATSLRALAENLGESRAPGSTPWILPLVKHRFVRRGFGQQFCPLCLNDSCYLRRTWRLAFVTVCPEHRCELLDRCPKCQTPFHFHRAEMGDRARATGSPAVCFQCKQDLRGIAVTPLSESENFEDVKSFQLELLRGAEQGWTISPDGNVVYSQLYFRVLRQLVKLLMQKSTAARLRLAVCEAMNAPMLVPAKEKHFERLQPAPRAILLTMSSWLLGEWPTRFIDLCRSNRIYSSILLRDFERPPFWFWQVVNEHLYIVHTPWRSGRAKEPHSYSELGRMQSAPKPRTAAQQNRIRFTRRRPCLWKDHTALAKALLRARLYSKKVHYSQVLKACPGLVAAAKLSATRAALQRRPSPKP